MSVVFPEENCYHRTVAASIRILKPTSFFLLFLLLLLLVFLNFCRGRVSVIVLELRWTDPKIASVHRQCPFSPSIREIELR